MPWVSPPNQPPRSSAGESHTRSAGLNTSQGKVKKEAEIKTTPSHKRCIKRAPAMSTELPSRPSQAAPGSLALAAPGRSPGEARAVFFSPPLFFFFLLSSSLLPPGGSPGTPERCSRPRAAERGCRRRRSGAAAKEISRRAVSSKLAGPFEKPSSRQSTAARVFEQLL